MSVAQSFLADYCFYSVPNRWPCSGVRQVRFLFFYLDENEDVAYLGMAFQKVEKQDRDDSYEVKDKYKPLHLFEIQFL